MRGNNTAVLISCAVALAVVGCAEPSGQPSSDGAVRDATAPAMDGSTVGPRADGGFMVLPEAGTTNPPPAGLCDRVCAHIYGDCMFAFRTTGGQTVTQSQCVEGCSMGALNGAERCLETVQCTQPAVSSCLQGAMQPDAGAPPPADSGVPAGNAGLEEQVLVIVNQRRAMGANCGGTNYGPAGPLVMNEQLRAAARGHSLDMGTRNFFDHNTPEGTTPFQRIAAAGYTGSPQGENIAAGNATAEATMTQWMNSPGHCQNIMNPQYRSIGVGYANVASSRYRHYWTQNFGGR